MTRTLKSAAVIGLVLTQLQFGCSEGETYSVVGAPIEGFPDDFLDYEDMLIDLRSRAPRDGPCGSQTYEVGVCEHSDVVFVRTNQPLWGKTFYYDAASGKILAHSKWSDLGGGLTFWPQIIECTQSAVTEEICTSSPLDLIVD